MKKTEEQKRQKEDARKRKQEERLQKHVVICPHCGEQTLDHMTECPHCGGALRPSGYSPMDEAKRQKIRRITYPVGIAVAIVIAVLIVVLR